MSLQDLFKKVDDESEFFKLAKNLVEPTDIKMMTDIDKTIFFAIAHLYADFSSKYFKVNCFETFLLNYYKLRVSANREGRKEILEASKTQKIEE